MFIHAALLAATKALLVATSIANPTPTGTTHDVGLIPPASMVTVGGQYYSCQDTATGANPMHPAWDPCNGVFDQ